MMLAFNIEDSKMCVKCSVCSFYYFVIILELYITFQAVFVLCRINVYTEKSFHIERRSYHSLHWPILEIILKPEREIV